MENQYVLQCFIIVCKRNHRTDSLVKTLNGRIHWKDWCWSWSTNTLATWCEELTHWKRPWCWERLKAGGEGDDRGWDGWMALPTQWTWVWASSGVGDGQGDLVCCDSWGHKESDTTEWLNWTELNLPSLILKSAYAAAAAKSLQSCPTLCDPIDGSQPGSPIPGILQARTLEWVAISFSNAWKWKLKVKIEREVAQSCLTLSDPMDCSPPGSSVHGIFQARVLEWGRRH